MSGIYYVDIADVLSDAGLRIGVGDQNRGWETRARSSGGFPSTPLAVFWHHTASSTSIANDLAWQCHGCDDAPVGNMTIARDGVVWPVAAGASNCAGKGGPATFSRGTIPADSGNTRGWNVEVANAGAPSSKYPNGEPWPVAQVDAYFAASNALNAYFGNLPTDVISHAYGSAECPGWTTRKIDPALAGAVEGPWTPRSVNSSGTWSLADIRAECLRRSTSYPEPEEADMTEEQAAQLDAVFHILNDAQAAFTAPDGSGASLSPPWASLWGYQLVAANVLPTLGTIEQRLAAVEAKLA